MIDVSQIVYKWHNERDVEVPCLLNFLEQYKDKIDTFLDVGCHYSWFTYAKLVRTLLKDKRYDALDILPDLETSKIVDHYYQLDLKKHDIAADGVSCISTIEHCGLSTYRVPNPGEEQRFFFEKLLKLTKKYLILTYPFGRGFLSPGQFLEITDTQLSRFEVISNFAGFRYNHDFFYNEFPQGKQKKWKQIRREEVKEVELDPPTKGTQLVGISHFIRL